MVTSHDPSDPIHAHEIEEHEREAGKWLVPFVIGMMLLAIAFALVLRHPDW